MTLKADAAVLLERLRNAHRARTEAIAARKHGAAHAAATIAQDLVDEAGPELLRAALVAAVQPDGGQPPIPVVFGPAPVVALEDVRAQLERYGQACAAFGRGEGWQGGGAYAELWASIQSLALLAQVEHLRGAQAEGSAT